MIQLFSIFKASLRDCLAGKFYRKGAKTQGFEKSPKESCMHSMLTFLPLGAPEHRSVGADAVDEDQDRAAGGAVLNPGQGSA